MNRKWVAFGGVAIACLAAYAGLLHFGPQFHVQDQVKAFLLDPDSAKFSGITFNSKNGVGCGSVNAKNRMGGYVGNTMFVVFPSGDVRLEPPREDSHATQLFLILMDSNCAKR